MSGEGTHISTQTPSASLACRSAADHAAPPHESTTHISILSVCFFFIIRPALGDHATLLSMNRLQHHRLALPLVGPALGGPALHHGLLRTYPCQAAVLSVSPEAKLTSALAQNAPLLHHPQIIMFSDLECDYINPIDLCNKLNQVCSRLHHASILSPSTLITLPLGRTATVHPARDGGARGAHALLPAQRAVGCVPAQRAARRIQREQGHEQKPHARRHRNLPHALGAQETVLHQARLLPRQLLLLPLQDDPRAHRRHRVDPASPRTAATSPPPPPTQREPILSTSFYPTDSVCIKSQCDRSKSSLCTSGPDPCEARTRHFSASSPTRTAARHT
ncbi:hypothetical protein L1887_58872 [Cichorium endivia]|nr:hypothetical protein L1887_58872 [Cichorium endivia]